MSALQRWLTDDCGTRSMSYAMLVLRVALAAMWISHASLKVFVYTMPGTVQFFESVGLSGLLAYPVVAAELAGGVAILLGFHGRVASLLMLPILLVAAWVHAPNGWVFSSAGGGWEYPVFLAAASVVHALLGDGVFRIRLTALRRRSGFTRVSI